MAEFFDLWLKVTFPSSSLEDSFGVHGNSLLWSMGVTLPVVKSLTTYNDLPFFQVTTVSSEAT